MDFQKLVHIAQTTFGAVITCLAVYTFLNINNYITFPVETQLNILWTLISLVMLIYGALQLMQGFISMFLEE
jgi:hypothetical protein